MMGSTRSGYDGEDMTSSPSFGSHRGSIHFRFLEFHERVRIIYRFLTSFSSWLVKNIKKIFIHFLPIGKKMNHFSPPGGDKGKKMYNF